MNIIVCLDQNGGMLFNKRRQSRDEKVFLDIKSYCDRLYATAFSEKLLHSYDVSFTLDDAMLDRARDGEWCFVESLSLAPYAEKIDRIVIYRWNRIYPQDFSFDLSLNGYKRVSVTEFAGKSHETITKEIYER